MTEFRKILHNWNTHPSLDPENFPKVDVVFTSPPYKFKDGYNEGAMARAFGFCHRVLRDDGLLFVNFGYLQEDMSRPYTLVSLLKSIHFAVCDTFIWIKNHYCPLPGNKRVNNLFEFVFMFCKHYDHMRPLDRLSIGVPYKDKSNVNRYGKGKDLRCGGNVWFVPIPTIQKSSQRIHHDEFPIELPLRGLKLAGVCSHSVVLDPFCGSGTTLRAAELCGAKLAIGVDRNEHWVS